MCEGVFRVTCVGHEPSTLIFSLYLASNTESQLPSRRPDSQLKLHRKGSDGAVKKHRVNGGGLLSTATPSSPVESGSSSLPRNLPKGILTSGTPPTSHLEQKAKELETSGSLGAPSPDSETTKPAASAGNAKKSSSLKKATSASSGLRMPSGKSGLTGLTRPAESLASAPVKEGGESEVADAHTTSSATSKLAGPMKKMTSASSLPAPVSGSLLSKPRSSRLAGPASTSKLLSMKSHPQVASLSATMATGSTSSLDSCNSDIIKVGMSEKIDEEIAKVEAESDKSSDVNVEQNLDTAPPSRLPPTSLKIDNNASPSKEADILSPPAEFKIADKTPSLRDTRRISPEGMSQEDSNNRPTETPPKTPGDDTQSPAKQDVVSSNISESVERNLKNERQSAGDSSSLVIGQGGENLPSTDDKIGVTPSSVSDSKHEIMKIGNEIGSRTEPKSKGFSQPETGQPAMDSPLLIQKSSLDMKTSPEQSGDDGTPRRASRDLDQKPHEHGKPRARSLSPKTTHRVGTVSIGHTYLPAHMVPLTQTHDFSRSASNDITGGRDRKPLKSSLRHSNSSAGVARNSSSSSLEGNPPGKGKVTISPRSSQVSAAVVILLFLVKGCVCNLHCTNERMSATQVKCTYFTNIRCSVQEQ